jgi:hypothetical protein
MDDDGVVLSRSSPKSFLFLASISSSRLLDTVTRRRAANICWDSNRLSSSNTLLWGTYRGSPSRIGEALGEDCTYGRTGVVGAAERVDDDETAWTLGPA